jgi:hypothetical protein
VAESDEEDTTASVAVLTRGVNLEWESAAIAPGTPLSPGLLKLKSGIAQIEFYQGARVLIEGPAELQLISSGEATCTRGKLSANVPPQAKGFRINTPKGTIVDLGTEFGLDVSDASAEVHVFKGEVELHKAAESMKSLKEGQAMAFAAESQMLAANASSFASLNEINARTALSDRSQFERWQAAKRQTECRSGLKLHFDFQDDETARSLRNHASQGEDGSIVGASWTTGRWPGKGALEFRNVSDRVRLSVHRRDQSAHHGRVGAHERPRPLLQLALHVRRLGRPQSPLADRARRPHPPRHRRSGQGSSGLRHAGFLHARALRPLDASRGRF